MSTTTNSVINDINAILNDYLETDSDSNDIIDELVAYMKKSNEEQLEALKDAHCQEIHDLHKAHKAELIATSRVVPLLKIPKTKSGDGRKPNPYSKFVGKVSKLSKGPDGDTLVTVVHNFKSPAGACAVRYQAYREELQHESKPIMGQTMTITELYNVITAAAQHIDPKFGNGMVRAGLMWGLISDDDRQAVLDA